MAAKPAFLTLAAALALLGLSACGPYSAREDAQRVAERYFAAAAGENYDAALALYAPQFFAATPRDEFRTVLSDMHGRCGAPEAHTLTSWSAQSNFGDGSSRVNLVYDVHYARCRVTETLGLSAPRGGALKIIAHHLQLTAGGQADGAASQTI
jgi:hypothetical protein